MFREAQEGKVAATSSRLEANFSWILEGKGWSEESLALTLREVLEKRTFPLQSQKWEFEGGGM